MLNKYKIGDKVKLIEDYWDFHKGEIFTIKTVKYSNGKYSYNVEEDEGFDSFHEDVFELIEKSEEKRIREKCLNTAISTVCKDRNNQYGEPEDVFVDVARLWDAYTNIVFDVRNDIEENELDVCMKQILLKIVRAVHNPKHMDNYVDIAGYAACAAELMMGK